MFWQRSLTISAFWNGYHAPGRNCLWAERKIPLTKEANPRETRKASDAAAPNSKLLDLVGFLARTAAETDFQEQMRANRPKSTEAYVMDRPQKGPRT